MPIALPLPVRLTLLVALGAALGSLINLAVYRLAWHRRAISPWSAPPPQAPPRRWSDCLPIVGWLGLRRESPFHGTLFWVRPMLTEIATATGLAWLYWWEVSKLGLVAEQLAARLPPLAATAVVVPEEILHATLLSHVVLMALMAVASLIDIDEKMIPDTITVPGTIVGLALAVALPWSLLPQVDLAAQVSPMATTLALAAGRPAIFPPAEHVTLHFLTLASPRDWPAALSGGRPGGLALGICCFWLWCFALAPRPWYGRHGWLRGWQILLTRLWRALRSGRMILLEVGGTLLVATTWLVGGPRWAALLTALVGLVGAGGVVWAVRLLGAAALKKEAMGFGDVTLMMMIGTFLGWQTSLVIFFMAPFAGLAIGVLQWIVLRDQLIPYGPFLCLAAVGTILWWASLWNAVGPVFSIGWLVPAAIIVCLPAMWGMLTLWHWVLSLFGWR